MLLNRFAEIGITNIHGETALSYASLAGHVQVVELLLNGNLKRTNTNNIEKCLCYASKQNHVQVVMTLLKLLKPDETNSNLSEQKIKTNSLYIASKQGHIEIVENLLEANVDPNYGEGDFMGKKRYTPLYIASKRGHFAIVQKLLSAKADPNADLNPTSKELHSRKKPLHVASCNGHNQIVELLLQKNANPNEPITVYQNGPYPASTTTALELACERGHTEVLDKLLKGKANPNMETISTSFTFGSMPLTSTPLYSAVKWDQLQIIDKLISEKVDPNVLAGYKGNKETSLYRATDQENLPVMKKLLEAGADPNISTEWRDTPILNATRRGNFEAVELLIENNAHPHSYAYSETVLHISAYYGHTNIFERILQGNINVNLRDLNGETALHLASRRGHANIVEILLRHNADPNIQRYYEDAATALHLATLMKKIKISKMLLESNADPNTFLHVPDKEYFKRKPENITIHVLEFLQAKRDPTFTCKPYEGFTALHIATMYDDREMVQLLIEYNADTTIRNFFGQTPLMIAIILQHGDIAEILKSN